MTKYLTVIPVDRPESKELMAELYGPLVGYWAGKFFARKNSLDHRSLQDLVQDGWLGALEAWDDYDQRRGASFLTYATSRIYWSIWNGARRADRNLGRAYTQCFRGLAKHDDMAALRPLSIDDPRTFGTVCNLATKDDIVDSISRDSFNNLLGMVTDQRLRWVVDQHYRADRTLEDIGRELGVSRERVRQLLVQARDMIREKLEERECRL